MFFNTMKFPIEQKKGLYCAWIHQNEQLEAPLVAVWIDPAMSAFVEHAIADSSLASSEELHACEEG